jgi:hypothetical protein
MGSKSTVWTSTTTNNDESVLQGLAAVRGDNNTTNVLDGDAIKEAFTFGTGVNAGQTQTIGEVLNTVNGLADKLITSASQNSRDAIEAMQSGLASSTGSIKDAYAQAANSGIDPQKALLGIAAIAALVFIFKG